VEKKIAHVDYQICMACGMCVAACPFGYLELSRTNVDLLQKAYPALIQNHRCTGCGLCAAACPIESIEIHD